MENEGFLKAMLARHVQKVFSFTLLLVGKNRDKAYQATVLSFAETVQKKESFDDEAAFFFLALTNVILKIKNLRELSAADPEIPPEKKRSYLWLREALQALPFEDRVPLLLRDQLHLLYKDIGRILKIHAKEAQDQVLQARKKLRHQMQKVLKRES